MSYFKKEEFECKCGCGLNNIEPYFVEMLDKARTMANIPFIITSGCRCPRHNKKEGGSKDSDHLTGEGADIRCVDSVTRLKILDSLLLAGFKRIGISKTFVHAGSRFSNPQEVMWLY